MPASIGFPASYPIAAADIASGAITNTQINASAAIAASKLDSGLMKLVAETVVAGAAVTQVDFTGLTGDTDKSYILWCTIKGVNSATTYALQLNDTTAAVSITLNVNNTTLTAGNAVANIGENDYSSRITSGIAFITVGERALTAPRERATIFHTPENADSTYGEISMSAPQWTVNAEITKISVVASQASGIAIGSRFTLWKVI
jgi:hypothetical protein